MRAWRGWFGWAALAGACAGISVTVRGAGAIVVPVVVVWLLFCRGRPTRDTALAAVLALVLSLGVVAGYIGWRHADTGLGGLTTNGNWNLYGRVAPFADCTKFKPPAGTEGLCDPTPPSERLGRFPEQGPGPGPGGNRWTSEYYIYFPTSPAQKLFGPPYLVSSDPKANAKLQKWSIAAIKGQPLDYLDAVWNDTVRIVLPNHHSFGDLSADENIAFMLGGPDLKSGANDFVKYWQDRYYPHEEHHQGSMTWLRDYEALTRVEGGWMLLLLALAAVAPLAVPRRARAGAYLLVLMAFALLWFPIVTKGYDFRFVIPTLGPLFGAAALGAWGLAHRARGRDGASASEPMRASPEPEGHGLCGVCGAVKTELSCENCGASVELDVEESPARARRVLEAARDLVSNLLGGPGSDATPGMSGDHWKMSIGPDVAIGPVLEHRDGTRSPVVRRGPHRRAGSRRARPRRSSGAVRQSRRVVPAVGPGSLLADRSSARRRCRRARRPGRRRVADPDRRSAFREQRGLGRRTTCVADPARGRPRPAARSRSVLVQCRHRVGAGAVGCCLAPGARAAR